MAYTYEGLGIRRIAFGQLTLRGRRLRKIGSTVTRCRRSGCCPCGNHIQQVFAAEDFLNGLATEEELLDVRLALAPGVVMNKQLAPGEKGWVMEAIAGMRFAKGMPFATNVDAALLQLVNGCNGIRPLREILASMPAEPGQTAQTSRTRCLELARTLMRWGIWLRARRRR